MTEQLVTYGCLENCIHDTPEDGCSVFDEFPKGTEIDAFSSNLPNCPFHKSWANLEYDLVAEAIKVNPRHPELVAPNLAKMLEVLCQIACNTTTKDRTILAWKVLSDLGISEELIQARNSKDL